MSGPSAVSSYARPMEHRGDGLVLRRWSLADVSAVAAACQDAAIQRWIPVIPRPYTESDARGWIERCLAGSEGHQFAVTDNGRVVGSIGMRVNELATGHIGYWCAPGARGRGVTTRALRLVSRFGLDELGVGRLELITDPDNAASQRVATKVGFRREGVLRSHLVHPDGRRRDSVMFSLLPGELLQC